MMKKILAGGIAAMITAIAHAQSTPPPTSPATIAADVFQNWTEPAEPMKIVGPIYFVGTKGLGVFLIATPNGHMLIGGAMPGSGNQIADSIRKLGFKPEDVKLLVVNHAHVDHVGSLAELKKLTGATVMAMDREVDLLGSGGKLDYLFANSPRFFFPAVSADCALKDGDTVELGGVALTALRTAGHTRGTTTYTTTVEDEGKDYVVVFADGLSINPGTRLVNNSSYPEILDDYRQSVKTLEELKPDIFISYHAEAFDFPTKRARAATEGVKAFVDPDGYRAYVANGKSKIEQLVAQEKAGQTPASGGK